MDADLAAHLDAVETLRGEQARQLHGELGGLLTAARMILATLDTTPDQGPLARIDSQLAEALAIKQRIVEALRPGMLDHFGPGSALVSYFETNCQSAGVPFHCDAPFGLPFPAPTAGIVLYRIGESVLALALRDSPSAVRLKVSSDAGQYRVVIGAEAVPAARSNAPFLGVLARWIARHGGSLEGRMEGTSLVVEAAVPLR